MTYPGDEAAAFVEAQVHAGSPGLDGDADSTVAVQLTPQQHDGCT